MSFMQSNEGLRRRFFAKTSHAGRVSVVARRFGINWALRGLGWSRGAPVGPREEVEVFQDGSSHTAHPEGLDVHHCTFAIPGLTPFCQSDELGLETVGQSRVRD